MIKRTLDISDPAFLHLKQKQLLIDKDDETIASIPVEDIGIIILENPQIVITQAVAIACQKNNVILVFCDDKHLPYSVLLPVSDANTLHNKVLQEQTKITRPAKKRLWKEVVINKIKNQIVTLSKAGKSVTYLERLVVKVKSGDPENIEAQAARKYWGLLFGKGFKRDIDEPGINALLNYGYSIVRAMVARAIVGAGLHPALGIFHKNQYNGLCLADDLMEPMRPWIDWLVYDYCNKNNKQDIEINLDSKKTLLSLPANPVVFGNKKMPLMNACHYLMADFKKAMNNTRSKLHFPVLVDQLSLL